MYRDVKDGRPLRSGTHVFAVVVVWAPDTISVESSSPPAFGSRPVAESPEGEQISRRLHAIERRPRGLGHHPHHGPSLPSMPSVEPFDDISRSPDTLRVALAATAPDFPLSR